MGCKRPLRYCGRQRVIQCGCPLISLLQHWLEAGFRHTAAGAHGPELVGANRLGTTRDGRARCLVRSQSHFSHRLGGEDGGRQSIGWLHSPHLLSIACLPGAKKRGKDGAANGRVVLPHSTGSRRDTSRRVPSGTQRLGH
eukprot:scaffold23779_cov112-Isochrysis_galbana.AAC.8